MIRDEVAGPHVLKAQHSVAEQHAAVVFRVHEIQQQEKQQQLALRGGV